MTVDGQSGAYRALKKGKVTVTASHPKAAAPVKGEIEIAAPEEAKLEFRPAKIELVADSRTPLNLLLLAGTQETKLSLAGDVPELKVTVGNPDAVQLNASLLTGVTPAAPFKIVAAYKGATAEAQVEVLDKTKAGAVEVRAVPSEATLASGQSVSPAIERRVAGKDQWVEVNPAKVQWKVPEGLRDAATAELRPQAEPIASAKGPLELAAEYGVPRRR